MSFLMRFVSTCIAIDLMPLQMNTHTQKIQENKLHQELCGATFTHHGALN